MSSNGRTLALGASYLSSNLSVEAKIMKYKITIEKVETVTRKSKEWLKQYEESIYRELLVKNPDLKQYDYVTSEHQDEEETTVYTQVSEGDIDLMAVVTAFNKPRIPNVAGLGANDLNKAYA